VSCRVGTGSRWLGIARWLSSRVGGHQPGTARARGRRTPSLTRSTRLVTATARSGYYGIRRTRATRCHRVMCGRIPAAGTGKINWVLVWCQELSDPERHPTNPQETGTDNTHRVFVTHRGSKPLSVAPGRDPVDAHPTHAIERTLRPLLSGTNSWQTAGGGV